MKEERGRQREGSGGSLIVIRWDEGKVETMETADITWDVGEEKTAEWFRQETLSSSDWLSGPLSPTVALVSGFAPARKRFPPECYFTVFFCQLPLFLFLISDLKLSNFRFNFINCTFF